jgi:hypothetical protein
MAQRRPTMEEIRARSRPTKFQAGQPWSQENEPPAGRVELAIARRYSIDLSRPMGRAVAVSRSQAIMLGIIEVA